MATLQISAPGVPPLIGGVSIVLPTLLTGDTFTGYGSPSGQQWGVWLGGAPVVTFDTFVSIDYRQGWALSDYPVERGGFQTYDKVQLPFDVRVKFASGFDESNRSSLLSSVASISRSLLLYDVVTPEKVYTSVNVQHYDYHRTSTNGVGVITVEMWLLEIRVTNNTAQNNTGANGAPVDANGAPVTPTSSTGSPTDTSGSPSDPSGNSPASSDSGSVTPVTPSQGTIDGIDSAYGIFPGGAGS